MFKAILITILLRTALQLLLISESTIARSMPWKFVALEHYNSQGLSNSVEGSRNEDAENMSDVETDFADFELDDLVKREEDDYGHMRFGRSNANMSADYDHVHMRFGRSNTNQDHVFKKIAS
ncbi:hypothetical protein HNY73_022373 [Argiope bruennichi]|uniref:Uncharacterized protein n=1 Tax=Argiope bruennichi TaxID=94029 RepID=A0A8T0E4W7_ARGBR|nr:hypothetical protein HNY73_022373 [Argiope bruennichi]